MKVYIAGKVTGLPVHEVTMKFGASQKELQNKGFEAINPLVEVSEKGEGWLTPWHRAMCICIGALVQAQAILLLSDWAQSKGAIMEYKLALELQIPVFTDVESLELHRKRHFYEKKD